MTTAPDNERNAIDLRSVDEDDPPGRMPEATDQPCLKEGGLGNKRRRWKNLAALRQYALGRCRVHGLVIDDVHDRAVLGLGRGRPIPRNQQEAK